MPKVSEIQAFIDKMKAEYGRYSQPQPFSPMGPMNGRANGKRLPMMFTGAGPDGVIQPEKPAMVDNRGGTPKMFHEGELIKEVPGGRQVIPANEVQQQDLAKLEKQTGMPGFATGTEFLPDKPPPMITSSGGSLNLGTATPPPDREGINKPPPIIMSSGGSLANKQPADTPVEGVKDVKPIFAGGGITTDSGVEIGAKTPEELQTLRDMQNKAGTGAGDTGRTATEQPVGDAITDEATGRLADISRGEGEARLSAEKRATDRLASQQAAEKMAARQQAAQSGATSEEALASMERLDREHEGQTQKLQADLADQAALAAEAATVKLFDTGIQADLAQQGIDNQRRSLDDTLKMFAENKEIDWFNAKEARRQYNELSAKDKEAFKLEYASLVAQIEHWDAYEDIDWAKVAQTDEELAKRDEWFKDEMGLKWSAQGLDAQQVDLMYAKHADEMKIWGAEFEEDNRRYGLDYALKAQQYNWDMNSAVANMMMEAGDFTGATKLFNSMGFNVDLGALKDTKSAADAGNAMANLLTNLQMNPNSTMTEGDNAIQMTRYYNAMSGGTYKSLDEIKKADPVGYTNLENQFKAAGLSLDPVYSEVQLMEPTITAIIGPDNIDTFSYAGKTGIEAGKLAMTQMLSGMQVKDGNLSFNFSDFEEFVNGTTTDTAAATTGTTTTQYGDVGTGYVAGTSQQNRDANLAVMENNIAQGIAPTAAEIKNTLPQEKWADIPMLDDAIGALTGQSATFDEWKKSHPDGLINYGGTPLKLVTGTKVAPDKFTTGYTQFSDMETGLNYYATADGKWVVDYGFPTQILGTDTAGKERPLLTNDILPSLTMPSPETMSTEDRQLLRQWVSEVVIPAKGPNGNYTTIPQTFESYKKEKATA